MRPQTIGRAFGIGLRVAGRLVGQRVMGPLPQAPARVQAPASSTGQTAARITAQAGRGVAQGASGFWRSLRRASGIVWLEVSGVFFFLPVLVFAPTLWRTRMSYAHGPDHRTFVVSTIVVVVFFYLGVTSFWRARRR